MSEYHVRMLTYSFFSTLICCSLLLLYMLFFRKGNKIKTEDILIAVLLVVVSSLRYGVGSDYFRYMDAASAVAYRNITSIKSLFSIDFLEHYGAGYKLLAYFASRISDSPYMIFWIVSFIIYVPIVRYCRKYTRNALAALAIYLLFGYWGLSLNAIRQSIAMVMILFSETALEKKQYVKTALLIACAVLFHTTAIVPAAVIILVNFGFLKILLEPKQRNLILMIVIGGILRSLTGVIEYMVSHISFFSEYAKYINTETSEQLRRSFTMFGVAIETLLIISFLYIAIKNLDKLMEIDPRVSKMISIIMMGIPFSIIGISNSEWLWLSNRFAEYFFQFILFLIPLTLGSMTRRHRQFGVLSFKKKRVPFWVMMIIWHAAAAILLFNNNQFVIDTYLLH